jgi:glycosyltransferase involved in cell wall biosynthesis
MSEPITIMHLRASNFVGGPEKQILEHFLRLDSSRFKPVLGTFVEDGQTDHLGEAALAQGFRCIRLQAVSPLNPASVYQLSKILKQEKISILCTHGYKPNILGCLAARLTRIQTIAISRGWTYESPKIRLYEEIDRLFLRLTDHIVAVSSGQQKKVLQCGLPHHKVSVIHNAINLKHTDRSNCPQIREELGIPRNSLLVISAGRLSPEKNYATMIEVAQKVISQNNSVYFAIFGEGFLREKLERQIHEKELNDRFLLPGFRKNILAILKEIDIFMLPSLTEGLPNVALEAFAARKPIIASAVGGTPEIVQDGISGFLTAPDDSAGMSESLLKLTENPELRQQMGEIGYRYITEHFDFEVQTKKYEELYDTIYHRRHPRPQ